MLANNPPKKTAKLTNWIYGSIETIHGTEQVLFGECFDHSYVEQGNRALTSQVLELDLANKKAETQNTIYHLGEQSEIHRDTFTAWQKYYKIQVKAWEDVRKNHEQYEKSGGDV